MKEEEIQIFTRIIERVFQTEDEGYHMYLSKPETTKWDKNAAKQIHEIIVGKLKKHLLKEVQLLKEG